jgi:hypothetical protein
MTYYNKNLIFFTLNVVKFVTYECLAAEGITSFVYYRRRGSQKINLYFNIQGK